MRGWKEFILIPMIVLALSVVTCNVGPLSMSLVTRVPPTHATLVTPTQPGAREAVSPQPTQPASPGGTTEGGVGQVTPPGSPPPPLTEPAQPATVKPTKLLPLQTATPEPPVGTPALLPISTSGAGGLHFSSITFCKDVNDDGEPIGQATAFTGGTTVVYSLFNYEGMTSGTLWRREWKRDGRIVTGVDDTWAEDESGWIAYPLEDPISLAGGNYTFSVYIEGQLVQQASFTMEPPPPDLVEKLKRASLGQIVFCQDVTDDGEPVKPADKFPGGTTEVWAFFTHQSMVSGQLWGRRWELDGEEYVDATGETWEGDADGWVAYSISDEDGLAAGRYTLNLFIGDRVVQEASFEVAKSPPPRAGGATFGAIAFARNVTEKGDPVESAFKFDAGITRVYGVFVYLNMTKGQSWSHEWLRNGQQLARSDLTWEAASKGNDYCYFEDKKGLSPGKYTLNLYIEGRLVRSASFEVVEPPRKPTTTPPKAARPEDLVAPELMPAWRKLANSTSKNIPELAQLIVKYRIPIRFGNAGNFDALYTFDEQCNTVPGQVLVSRQFWSSAGQDEVAAMLAHELTHASQVLNGASCYCSVEKEYYAYLVLLQVLHDSGRDDVLVAKWAGVLQGGTAPENFNRAALWQWIKRVYSECREYG